MLDTPEATSTWEKGLAGLDMTLPIPLIQPTLTSAVVQEARSVSMEEIEAAQRKQRKSHAYQEYLEEMRLEQQWEEYERQWEALQDDLDEWEDE